MTADRADALALCLQQGIELLFPEGTLQGQAAKHRLLAQAKGQVVLEGRAILAVALQKRVVLFKLAEPGPALGLGKGP